MGCYTEISKSLRIRNTLIRVAFAEFLGTCVLIVFGDGSVAQSVLSKSTKGEFISINWCWCMAVMMGVYCSIGVSGGHINPAVSLAMTLIGRLSVKKCVVYMMAQYLGAFTGAAIVFLVYYDAINAFDGGIRISDPANSTATAGIFATYPQEFLTLQEGLADQIVGTALLLLGVMAITDKRNAGVPMYLVPLLVGLNVFVIGAAYGFNCGYAINPARDLSPRIFTAVGGWGIDVFSYRNYKWFWIPIIGPHIGAVIAAFLYIVLIELHWPPIDEYDVMKLEREEEDKTRGNINSAVGEEASTNV